MSTQKTKSSLLQRLLSGEKEKSTKKEKSPVDQLNEILQNKRKSEKEKAKGKKAERPEDYNFSKFTDTLKAATFVKPEDLDLENPESIAEALNAGIRFAAAMAVKEASTINETSSAQMQHDFSQTLQTQIAEVMQEESLPSEIRSNPVQNSLYQTLFNQLKEASPDATSAELREATLELLSEQISPDKNDEEKSSDSEKAKQESADVDWAEHFDFVEEASPNKEGSESDSSSDT